MQQWATSFRIHVVAGIGDPGETSVHSSELVGISDGVYN
jgi:hypothetical protein